MANALKQIQPGGKPLSTDVDQFRLLLSGLADFGALTLFQPIPNPAAPTVAVAQISGVLNGAYQYIQVNVTGWVGSDGSFYVAGFAPSPASATVNPANQQVTVTLTTGPSGTIARLLYRTTAGGNTFKYLTWIGDNTTTTYTDNTADINLGAGMPGPASQPSVNGTAIPSTAPSSNTTGTTFAMPMLAPTGLTGATAASRYVGATVSGAPTSGTFNVGDFVVDQTGKIWICTVAGTPGTWVSVGGPGNMNLEFEVARFFAAGGVGSSNATSGLNVSTSVTSAGNPQGSASYTEDIGSGTQSSLYYTAAIVNKVNPSALYQYEVNIKTSNSSYTASSALWDITAGAIVSGSTVTTTSTTPVVLRSSSITLVAGHQYVPTLWISSASGIAVLSGARIVGQI